MNVGVVVAAIFVASLAAPCAAQSHDEEVVVTARKRDETSIAVPFTITAVSGAELQRRAIVSLDDRSQVVPQLLIGNGGGTVSSGNMVIRGLAGSDSNSFGDQAVSFNIDGVPIGRTIVRRIAEMDIAQIEVLKVPQALFFGKNSPARIISIRSADPTPNFQGKASVGYEFNAHEIRGDGFVSGPLTETLGARISVIRI